MQKMQLWQKTILILLAAGLMNQAPKKDVPDDPNIPGPKGSDISKQSNQEQNLSQIQNDIQRLEKGIGELISFHKTKNKPKVTIQLSSSVEQKYGQRTRQLVQLVALMEMSGKQINSLTFIEKKSNLATNTETIKVRITKGSFPSNSYAELKIEEVRDREFEQGKVFEELKLSELTDPRSKKKLLVKYRGFLQKLEFRLTSQKIKIIKEKDYKLNRIFAN